MPTLDKEIEARIKAVKKAAGIPPGKVLTPYEIIELAIAQREAELGPSPDFKGVDTMKNG